MTQIFLTIAAIFGGLSVAAGAFGAHALREKVSERMLEIFDTGARYQMYHALALLLVAILISRFETPPTTLLASGWLFIIGVVIFSGSLYAITFSGIKSLGAIAPLGGVSLMAGWAALAITAATIKF
ncbi:DUF423 domain-containing protein [Sphaerospermopsis kisseleviana CS-549]|jgi:uncharacterized membrane protein YgdD (TMEM256/DUF423 family)|uniref:DUF423 domain-containing protein n=2 Tax=Sphaerospermopsis TaxID=752201 RepID=A0ABR9VCW1_9CYAN|nr:MULTISPECIES: DUF423 domain-containing protein [Sphaerospermopsis]MBD2132937.1 DUF423 domain-containing protein [Sphaerospermopsis sp. FACHB-1094]MBE9236314.1 DUF423 domain-containing protein [Sphaerospermopsis aphanizomenoides LEGE 00250]MDB9444061.1 DUF423 domain-containing protein [Sphaerospermopsis kisseleviana CS-549]BAZ80271.1 hypothetical protein NIES73_15210 [Sphaerospermopsis kisseleviana NIES-73]